MRSMTSFVKKVVTGFAGLLVIAVALAMIAVWTLRSTTRRTADAVQSYSEDLVLAERLRFLSEQVAASSRGYLLIGDRQRLPKIRAAEQEFLEDLRLLRDRATSVEDRERFDRIERSAIEHGKVLERMLSRRAEASDFREI